MERDTNEIIIKAAFDNMNMPEVNAMKDIEAILAKKSARPLKKTFIAVFIVISLMTTVVGAAQYFGSFDRLMRVIGEDAAAVIQPVRSDAYSQGRQFVGGFITDDGVRVELVAAGVFDNMVDVFITLEDLEGDRFRGRDWSGQPSSSIGIVEFNLDPVGLTPVNSTTFSPSVFHIEDGIYTLHGRKIFPFSVADMELSLEIGRIFSTPVSHHNHVIDLTQVDIPTEPPTVLLSSLQGQSAMQIREEVTRVLKPHQTEYEFGIEGVTSRISAIGWVDDKLHVQLYNPDFRSNHWVSFVDNYARRTNHYYGIVALDTDTDGNLIHGTWTPFSEYIEIIFDISPEDIGEYEFHGFFTGFDQKIINRSTIFTVEANERQLAAGGLEISVGNSFITEVIVNPSGVRLSGIYTAPRESSLMDYNHTTVSSSSFIIYGMTQAFWSHDISRYYTGDRIAVTINTTDGPVRGFLSFFSRDEEEGFIHIFGLNRFIDLDTVVSVGVAGRQIVTF